MLCPNFNLCSSGITKGPALAAVLVLAAGPFVIPELHKLKFGQSIREEGPKSHQAKSGTPTMGGVMIIAAITLATLAEVGQDEKNAISHRGNALRALKAKLQAGLQ